MRDTLLHVRETLTPQRHETLCRVLSEHGATCETRFHSRRPQLLFIGYSEAGAAPGQPSPPSAGPA